MRWCAGAVLMALAMPVVIASEPASRSTPSESSPLVPPLATALARLGETPNMLALQAALQQLELAYPGRICVESYGTSQQGRGLYRLRVLPWDGELGRSRPGLPAVCLVTDLDSQPDALPMLQTIAEHLRNPESPQSIEWIAYPMPNPDRWVTGEEGSGSKRARLNRNFPEGWSPWSKTGVHPGSAPLSEPEAKSLAASLAGCDRAVTLILLGEESPESMGAPGSLRRFAKARLTLQVQGVSVDGDWTRVLESMEDQRPKLEVSTSSIKRLSQDLHMVDILVANRGQGDAGLSRVALELTGASCLKLAWASEEGAAHALLDSRELPELVGGARPIRVRLVLRVSDPESVTVHLDSPRVEGVAWRLDLGNPGVALR